MFKPRAPGAARNKWWAATRFVGNKRNMLHTSTKHTAKNKPVRLKEQFKAAEGNVRKKLWNQTENDESYNMWGQRRDENLRVLE